MITFTNGRIIQPDCVLTGYCLTVSGEKITGLYRDTGNCEGEVIDARGNYISPGFIDIHVHGGGEGDFLDRSLESIENIIKIHTIHGTTGIYPTTLSCDEEETYGAIDSIKAFKAMRHNGAEILGIHLEGPYFSMSQRGAQDPKYIKTPRRDEYTRVLDYSSLVRRVTFAPEIDGGMDLADELKSRGIMASIGHSDAEYDEVVEAMKKGVRHINHLYSGMQGVHRVKGFRRLGIVECAYLLDDMTVEVIADGCHLPAELLRLIYKIKGTDKIALITDAMRAAGRTEGESILGSRENGQRVILKDGVAYMPDFESFAGSIATTDILVRNMYKGAGVEIYNAVKMASLTPSVIMGCSDRKGSLTEGKDADVIMFDDDINIKYVMVRGKEFTSSPSVKRI